MSPLTGKNTRRSFSFPRTRGDEPHKTISPIAGQNVFPAHAGMSPSLKFRDFSFICFPRTRGDEPVEDLTRLIEVGFSPHTRG